MLLCTALDGHDAAEAAYEYDVLTVSVKRKRSMIQATRFST